MLFFKKKEINYEMYFKNTLIKILSNKENKLNKYIFLNKLKIKIFFWFKKIKEEELSFTKLFNHLILLWLITNEKLNINKLNSVLNKGIRYYRFLFEAYISNIYYMINFLNEILLPLSQKNSKKVHIKEKKKYLASYSDFDSFTNLRLSSNLYLNSVHEKLYISIKIKENININLNLYLTCLKL